MAQRPEDRFANLAHAKVTESASGTITYTEVLTGISLGQRMGMLIDQIDYYPGSAVLEDIIADADYLQAGWFTTNTFTGFFDWADRRLIHGMQHSQSLVGAVVSQFKHTIPWVYKFTPPIIYAGPRLYLAVRSASIAAPAVMQSRLYYRYIELTPQEYLEIAETFILVG